MYIFVCVWIFPGVAVRANETWCNTSAPGWDPQVNLTTRCNFGFFYFVILSLIGSLSCYYCLNTFVCLFQRIVMFSCFVLYCSINFSPSLPGSPLCGQSPLTQRRDVVPCAQPTSAVLPLPFRGISGSGHLRCLHQWCRKPPFLPPSLSLSLFFLLWSPPLTSVLNPCYTLLIYYKFLCNQLVFSLWRLYWYWLICFHQWKIIFLLILFSCYNSVLVIRCIYFSPVLRSKWSFLFSSIQFQNNPHVLLNFSLDFVIFIF